MCENLEMLSGLHQDQMIAVLTTPALDQSEEAKRKRRSANSMRWNNKNKDKVHAYIKKYSSKPERVEYVKKTKKEKFAAMSPEEKEAFKARVRANWLKRNGFANEEEYSAELERRAEERRLANEAKMGATEEERKEKKRIKNRARYQSKTIEERRLIFKRQAEYGTPESREAKRERDRLKARERYHAMSPEDRQAMIKKQNDRVKAKKIKEQEQDGS